ncbi:BON domain-containing protein [Geotalea sp. SG265]|uniref:BON domain-containing protein n=1 Tax=Geotalea sp. SG265 TaxID=2922867 RepID=UPI001FAE76E4|nr:BON domain-containing protein [Geotalea sp. SG265]
MRYLILRPIVLSAAMAVLLLCGCASRQGPHEGNLLDNKVTAQRVHSALKDAGLKHVRVSASRDGITLTGTVRSEEERSRAEQVAKGVQRAMELKNELQVRD